MHVEIGNELIHFFQFLQLLMRKGQQKTNLELLPLDLFHSREVINILTQLYKAILALQQISVHLSNRVTVDLALKCCPSGRKAS